VPTSYFVRWLVDQLTDCAFDLSAFGSCTCTTAITAGYNCTCDDTDDCANSHVIGGKSTCSKGTELWAEHVVYRYALRDKCRQPGNSSISNLIQQFSFAIRAWLGLWRGAFTCVGWQVTLCDPIWQVTPVALKWIPMKSYIWL